MIITRKAISRRTVLRGLGVTVALPLLDAMIPPLTALSRTPAKPVRRLGVIYVPHGANMSTWTPAAEGTAFGFTPALEPLAPFRDRLLVLTGLDNQPALSRPGEPAGAHGNICGSFPTGVHIKPTDGADVEAGVSMDQIAAAELGQHTQLASLEVGLDSTEYAGGCDAGYSCAYTTTISWRTPTTPLPMENNPRAIFERLFGDGPSTDPAVRRSRNRRNRSILDTVTREVARLKSGLASRDRAKLTDYLESARDVERRIQKAEEQSDRELPVLEQPRGIPETFEGHAKVMFDLQVLAYQADLTRVITFMIGKEVSQRTYPEIGVREGHHAVSHHQNNLENLAGLTRINTYHTELFAYFLDKLQSTADGDGSLLDHLMLIYGSGMSDSNAHTPLNLPILLVGGGAGQIKGGRHIGYPEGTPLTNLYTSVLGKLGVAVERIGDSNGELKRLSDV